MLSFFLGGQSPDLPERVTRQILRQNWNIKLSFLFVVSVCKPLLCIFSSICWPLINMATTHSRTRYISMTQALPKSLMIWMEALWFSLEHQHFHFTVSTQGCVSSPSLNPAWSLLHYVSLWAYAVALLTSCTCVVLERWYSEVPSDFL